MKLKRETSSLIKRVVVLIAIVTGCIVLAGWFFNIPSFKNLLPRYGTMRINTAICFILSGLALYFFRDGRPVSKSKQIIGYVFSSVILVIGILSLCNYFFGWDGGINELFWNAKMQNIGDHDYGKMSLIVAFNFTLSGIIFLLLGNRKYNLIIQVLLVAMIPGSLVVIISHLFGISFLNSIPLQAPTSMLTAILFIVLFAGIFISPALEYIQFSFVKKIAVFFVLVVLLRGTVFFAIDRNNQLSSREDKLLANKHDFFLLAEKINAQCNNIQSATRGYIISGEENLSPVLNQTIDSVNNIIIRLRTIISLDPVQQAKLDSLKNYFNAFVNSQIQLVNVRRNNGFEAAQKMIKTGRETALLDHVHSMISSVEQKEDQIFELRKSQNELIVKNSSKIFTLFQLIAGLLLVIAFKMIYDHIRLRNKIEEELKKSLKETSDYKYALNESSIVSITDDKGIIKHVNDNFCKISKHNREELIGQDHIMLNSGYHSKEFMRDIWFAIENGKVWRGELKNKAKDGTCYWVDTIIVPFINEAGKPYQYLALRSDITQRKKLEAEILQMNQELQARVEEKTKEVIEKEQQYRFVLENMREGIQLIDFNWKYLFVNSSAAEHSKYSDHQLPGNTLMERYPGIEKTELFGVLESCMKNRCPKIIENEFTFPDGSRRWFELSIQPVPEGLFILSMDICERKKVEQQLQESERFLNDSQEVSKIGSYVLDLKNGIWKASKALDDIFGLSPDCNHTIELWISILHPDDRAMMQEYFAQEVICKKKRFDKEYKIINQKTGRERCVHGIGDLELDSNGNIVKMLGTIQDITERKNLEKELANQKLNEQKIINETTIQAQEKERKELGRELHDNVNQILATVKMYLGMLNSGDCSKDDNLLEKSYDYVNEAMKEIRKLSHTLVAPSLGDLGLKEALQILADDTNLLNGLKVDLYIDEKYNEKNIDKTKELMLYRVVQEQLTNITKYSRAKEASITLKKTEDTLYLTIADNGVGFDTTQKSKGIGLTNMKSRIEYYSGNLNIISAPRKGCKVEISIPAVS